ncbi:MAG: ROK family protein [Candidatus Saccharimonas sp.]
MIIAIDTGGTKTLICAFHKNGKMETIARFPTPAAPVDYVALLKQTIRDKFRPDEVELIVLALPGIIKDDVAIWCQNLKWRNFNVQKQLGNTLAGVPILVENDANLGGLSETRALNPIPKSSLYITISTGIGSGYSTNGHIDQGLRLSEAGRILIEYRGKIATWEDTASGSAIVRTYKKMARDIKKKRTWNAIADRISRGFVSLIPVIQPDVIIIGGSVGTYFNHYSVQLKDLLNNRLPANIPLPKIVKAQHPELAVIYGCYYYGKDHLANK